MTAAERETRRVQDAAIMQAGRKSPWLKARTTQKETAR